MTAQSSSAQGVSRQRLFAASCIALVATAMTFAARADIMDALGHQFHLNKEQVGAIAGIALIGFTVAADGYWLLWTGTLLVGLGNGLIEAAVNPLIATMYAGKKTPRLNALHAWFPGGIVIGGVLSYFDDRS